MTYKQGLLILATVLSLSTGVSAALHDRGGGLIYDDVLNLTWLQDAGLSLASGTGPGGSMNWAEANAWAANLVYYDSVRKVYWSDWRLPTFRPLNGAAIQYVFSTDGSTDWGYNISAPGSAYPGTTASELSYMFYQNLGNIGLCDVNGNCWVPGWGIINPGPFLNLANGAYWTDKEYAPDSTKAWLFYFVEGHQSWDPKETDGFQFAWAVRPGDVVGVTKPSEVVDFTGDGKSDVAVYETATGFWYIHYSGEQGYGFDAIGVGGGPQWTPVPGNYNGDVKTDVAVYDKIYGWWLVHYSSGGYYYDHIGMGGTGYTPVPGDYDGDGTTDLAVYQETTGDWFFKYSSGGYGYINLGGPGKIPVVADYDGDKKTDIAVYQTVTGYWFFYYSKTSTYGFDAIGVGGGSQWSPVPGDYDGDGKADVAVYDTVYGWWLFHYSSGTWDYDHIGQGGTGFTPVPGYYDSDGKTDLAVYNHSNGSWFFKYSSGTYGYDSLGGSGWVPVR